MKVSVLVSPALSRQFVGSGRRRLVPAAALAVAAAAAAATPAWGATDTWVGSTAANWSVLNGFNAVPASGDALVFDVAGTAGTTLNDDLTSSSFNVAGITFTGNAPGYIIGGNAFNLTAGIVNSSAFNQSISDNIGLAAVQTFTTNNASNGGSVILSGNITGAGGFSTAGSGTLVLSGSNSFTGNATVNSGTVLQLQNTTGASTSAALNATSYGHLTLNGGSTVQLRSDVSTTFGGFTGLGGVGNATLKFDVNALTPAGTAGSTLTIGGFSTYNTTIVSSGGNNDVLGIGTLTSVGGALTLDATTANMTVAAVSGSPSLTVDGTGTTTVTGALTASGYIVKGGSGTLVMGGSDSFSGIYVYTGVVQAASSNAFGTSSTISQASGTRTAGVQFVGGTSGITIPAGVSFTVSNDGVTASGATVGYALDNVSGNSTLLGTVNMTSGGGNSVIESDAGLFTLTNISNVYGSQRTAVFQGAGNGLVAGKISDGSSSTAITMQGTGTWTLAGSNTYSGGTTITSGLLQVGNGGTTGNLGTGPVVNNAQLAFNVSNGLTIANAISGTGTVALNGSGTVTLSGANGYTGTTGVNAGTLVVTGSLSGTPAVTVAGGAGLGGTGSIAGAVTAAGGSSLTLSAATSGSSLTLGNGLTLGTAGTYGPLTYTTLNYTLGTGNAVESLNVSGALTFNGGGYISLTNANLAGTYTLATYGSDAGTNKFSLSPTTANVTTMNVGRNTETLTDNGTSLQLVIGGAGVPLVAYFDGAVSGKWNDLSNASKVNFSTNLAGTSDAGNTPGAVTDVILNANTVSGSTTQTLGASTTINSLNVNGNGTTTIAADGSTLTIVGAADSNTDTGGGYTGNPAGTGISIAAAANAFTVNTPIALGTAGANQNWTNKSVNLFTAGGNVTGSAGAGSTQTLTLVNTGAGGTTVGGTIADGSNGGNLAVVVANTGAGVTTFSASNTYTGGTTLTGGTLTATATGGFGTGNVTVAPTGSGTATLNSTNSVASTATVTLTSGSGLATANFNGTAPTVAVLTGDANSIASFYGASPIVGTLSGSLTTNFYGATPTVSVLSGSGVTKFNGSTPTVAVLNGSGGVVLNGPTGTNLTLGVTTGTYGNASYNLSAGISEGTPGMGSVTKVGSGTVTFNGTSNSYTGTTNVSAGTLQLNDTGVAIAGNVLVANGSFLTLLANQQIASTSAVTVASNGHFELNGFNQSIGALSTATTGTNSLVEGTEGSAPLGNQVSNLTINQSTNTTFDGIIRDDSQYGSGGVQGLLALTKQGTGTLTLTNTSGTIGIAFTGGLTISGGTLALADNDSGLTIYDFASAITDNANLRLTTVSTGNDLEVLHPLVTGSGTVEIGASNGGTIEMGQAQQYAGGTIVNGGAFRVTVAGATGAGPVVVNSGGTLGGTNAITNTTGPVTINAGGTITAGENSQTINTGSTTLGGFKTGTLTTNAQVWNSSTGTFLAKVFDTSNTAATSSTTGNDRLVMSSLAVTAPGFSVVLQSDGGGTLNASTGFTASNLVPNNAALSSNATLANGSFIVLAQDSESVATNPFASNATLANLSLNFSSGSVAKYNAADSIVLATYQDGSYYDLIAEEVASAPEPTSLLLAGVAAAPLALGRRRNRGHKLTA